MQKLGFKGVAIQSNGMTALVDEKNNKPVICPFAKEFGTHCAATRCAAYCQFTNDDEYNDGYCKLVYKD